MRKRTKSILIGSGVVAGTVAVAGAVSYSITKKLVEIALDREEDETVAASKKQISGAPEMNVFMKVRENAAEKLEHYPCDMVEITARDGVKLVGHWRPCENAKRVLIAMHGWRSSWSKDFGIIADFLHDNGCHVLYAEQRGQNNSGGDYMGFGLTERYDCLEWIHWVDSQDLGNLPVYLCGISMGASTVLMAAGFDLPASVHGIIADCGYTSPHAIWKHVAENNLHVSYDDWVSSMADEMCREKIQFSSKDYSCTEAMAHCNVPVLFIHGTDDDFVPVEMTYENYKACVSQKRLLIVPGAGHGMSYVIDKKTYERTVMQFWDDFDEHKT